MIASMARKAYALGELLSAFILDVAVADHRDSKLPISLRLPPGRGISTNPLRTKYRGVEGMLGKGERITRFTS